MTRTVLVTGGNRGIGLATALAFAKQGDRVAITYRNWTSEQRAAAEGLFGVHCDVTDTGSVDAAFTAVEAEFGPVEVLVANAGITEPQVFSKMTEEQFTRVLDTNLTGVYRCAKRAVPNMANAGWGRMIFISSVAAVSGSPAEANYAASKAGLHGMARVLTREFGPRNITTNVVAPGFVETDMIADLPKRLRTFYEKIIPTGRFATTDEVHSAITWLASDSASYVNGALIPIDGGMTMGH